MKIGKLKYYNNECFPPCFNQGSKCEEWKDEKKGSATVLYTQIINSQLVYTVHGTHFAEGSAAPSVYGFSFFLISGNRYHIYGNFYLKTGYGWPEIR